MKSNVGGIDRILRIGLGLAILTIGFLKQSYWGLVGLVPVATGLLRWCPAYLPLGLSTCPRKKD